MRNSYLHPVIGSCAIQASHIITSAPKINNQLSTVMIQMIKQMTTYRLYRGHFYNNKNNKASPLFNRKHESRIIYMGKLLIFNA